MNTTAARLTIVEPPILALPVTRESFFNFNEEWTRYKRNGTFSLGDCIHEFVIQAYDINILSSDGVDSLYNTWLESVNMDEPWRTLMNSVKQVQLEQDEGEWVLSQDVPRLDESLHDVDNYINAVREENLQIFKITQLKDVFLKIVRRMEEKYIIDKMMNRLRYQNFESFIHDLKTIHLNGTTVQQVGTFITQWGRIDKYAPIVDDQQLYVRPIKKIFYNAIRITKLKDALLIYAEEDTSMDMVKRRLWSESTRIQSYYDAIGEPIQHVKAEASNNVKASKAIPRSLNVKVQPERPVQPVGKPYPESKRSETVPRPHRDVGCYNCGEKGHISRYCPHPRVSKGVHLLHDDSNLLIIHIGMTDGCNLHTLKALVDTGATVSAINSKVLSRFSTINWSSKEELPLQTLATTIYTQGRVVIATTIQDHDELLEYDVIAINSPHYDIILGLPTILQLKLLSHVVNDLHQVEAGGISPQPLPTIANISATVANRGEVLPTDDNQDEVLPTVSKQLPTVANQWPTGMQNEIFTIDHVAMEIDPDGPMLDSSVDKMLSSTTVITTHDIRDKINTELDQSFRNIISDVLMTHQEIFEEALPPEGAHITPFHIELQEGQQFTDVKMRYFGEIVSNQIEAVVSNLLDEGIISPSSSSVASPTVIVPKPDGTIRLCLSYISLNKITVPLKFPMPSISNLLEALQGNQYYATLDLRSGYHQVLVDQQSRYLTAFRTRSGLYEFNRIPFGLKNAPNYFQQQMQLLLSPVLYRACLVFVDDIVIFGKDAETFTRHLQEVLDVLMSHNIRVKLAKCSFGDSVAHFLGYEISSKSFCLDDSHIQAVMNMDPPTTKEQLRSLLGLVNYHRHFIANIHLLVDPLQMMMKKNAKFQWLDTHQQIFEQIKSIIAQKVKLHHIDYTKEIIVRTDASKVGVGAMLLQRNEEDKEEVVSYASHRFTEAQQKWKTVEQEAYGIIYAVEKWCNLLLGQSFTIETDNKVLSYIYSSTVPKVVRWCLKLQEFQFNIKHIPGKDNVVADALSRCINTITSSRGAINHESTDDGSRPTNEQMQVLSQVHNSLIGHHGVEQTIAKLDEINKSIPKKLVKWFVNNCILCQKVRRGEAAFAATLHSSKVDEPNKVWAIDSIGPYPTDSSGNKYIIACIDCFTRVVELYCVKDLTADTFVTCLLELIARYGMFKSIRTDHGSNFDNKVVEAFLSILKMEHQFSIPYRHEANGIVERVNQEIGRHLRMLMASTTKYSTWSRYVPFVQRIVNTSFHTSIGTTPYRLLYGNASMTHSLLHEIKVQSNSSQDVSSCEDQVQTLISSLEVMHRVAKEIQEKEVALRLSKSDKNDVVEEGSYVLVNYPQRPPNKLLPVMRGPYIVVEVKSRGNVLVVQDINTLKVIEVHKTMCKPFNSGMLYELTQEEEQNLIMSLCAMDRAEETIVRIVNHHYYNKGYGKYGPNEKHYDFQVEWLNDPDNPNVWLSYSEVADTKAFHDYWQAHPKLGISRGVLSNTPT